MMVLVRDFYRKDNSVKRPVSEPPDSGRLSKLSFSVLVPFLVLNSWSQGQDSQMGSNSDMFRAIQNYSPQSLLFRFVAELKIPNK